MTITIITLFAMLIGVAIFFSHATISEAEWTILREDDIIRGDGIDGMLHVTGCLFHGYRERFGRWR